ncbi:MAG: hypothetical protein HC846_03005 [Blastocatellia bacterium]|nr:hypothetical protein [Blastocatellia bacterium]
MNQQPISPAVDALKNVIRNTVTAMNWSYQAGEETLTRLQWRAGRGQMQHFTGLALDIVLYASVTNQRILAHHLFALLPDINPQCVG